MGRGKGKGPELKWGFVPSRGQPLKAAGAKAKLGSLGWESPAGWMRRLGRDQGRIEGIFLQLSQGGGVEVLSSDTGTGAGKKA